MTKAAITAGVAATEPASASGAVRVRDPGAALVLLTAIVVAFAALEIVGLITVEKAVVQLVLLAGLPAAFTLAIRPGGFA